MKIIYEDKNLAIINKPAGLLVHPTQKDEQDTLVHKIIKKWPEIKKHEWHDPKRAGIVHRLDKDTSGTLVIAKNPRTLTELQNQFKQKQVKKIYYALVIGKVEPKEGTIESNISRDKSSKSTKHRSSVFSFSWEKQKPKKAITHYKVLNYFKYKNHILSYLEINIETGRTHQIRTHMHSKGHPIIGDDLYFNKLSKEISKDLNLTRQFLHSKSLQIQTQPKIKKLFEAPIAEELIDILDKLEIL